jgi:hypothetical protein
MEAEVDATGVGGTATTSIARRRRRYPWLIHYEIDQDGSMMDGVLLLLQVSVFPTFFYIQNNRICQYDGDRSEVDLLRYFSEVDVHSTEHGCSDYNPIYPNRYQKYRMIAELMLKDVMYMYQNDPIPTIIMIGLILSILLATVLGLYACLRYVLTRTRTRKAKID